MITALPGDPQTLLLDEPYQGMDADSQQRFWAMLWSWQEAGRSAVVASHSADALAKASTVIELDGSAIRSVHRCCGPGSPCEPWFGVD